MKDKMGRTVGVHADEDSARMQIELFKRIDRDDNYLQHEVAYTLQHSSRGMWVITKWVERFTQPDVWSDITKGLDDATKE